MFKWRRARSRGCERGTIFLHAHRELLRKLGECKLEVRYDAGNHYRRMLSQKMNGSAFVAMQLAHVGNPDAFRAIAERDAPNIADEMGKWVGDSFTLKRTASVLAQPH